MGSRSMLAVIIGGLLIIIVSALFVFLEEQETPTIKEEKTVTVKDVGDSSLYSGNKNNDTTEKTVRVVEEKPNPKYVAYPKSRRNVVVAYAILIGFFTIAMIIISKT